MIIGITARYEENGDEPFRREQVVHTAFVDIANKFGFALLPICPSIGLDYLVRECDGIIISGSSIDVDPTYYGEEPFNPPNVVDEYSMDRAIISLALKRHLPVFGICGGLQSINVFFGGSLMRDIHDHYKVEHELNVCEGALGYSVELLKLFKRHDGERVNSFHHQAIKRIGEGLTTMAKSSDGIVEAIAHKSKPVFGVQFHPEVDISSELYEGLFKHFLARCTVR